MSANDLLVSGLRQNVETMRQAAQQFPDNLHFKNALNVAENSLKNIELSMEPNKYPPISQSIGSSSAPPHQPGQRQEPSLVDRVTELERRMSVPVNLTPEQQQAAQVGAMIMAALGQSMNQEQANFVQQKLESSPQFFASEQCKVAIDLFIEEWKNFEGGE